METKLKMKVPMLDLQKKYDGRAFNMQINNTGDQPVRVRLFGNGQTFAEVVDQEEAKAVAPLKMFSSLDEIIAFAVPEFHAAFNFSFMWLGPDTTFKPDSIMGSAIKMLKKGVIYNIKMFHYDTTFNEYSFNGYESNTSFRKISQAELTNSQLVTDTPILFETAINKNFIFIADGSFSKGLLPLVNADSFVNNAVYWYGKTNPFTNETTESPCIYFLCDFTKIPTQADLNPVVDVTFEEFRQLQEQDNIEFGKYYHITDYVNVVNDVHLSILQRPNEITLPDLLITINKDGKYTGWYGDSKIIYTPEKCDYLWFEPNITINIDGIDINMIRSYENDKTINNKWYYCFMYISPIDWQTTYYYFPKELDSESTITYYQSQTGLPDLLEKQGLVLPSVDYTTAISYKGAILRLTDIYGNSFPFDFLHIGLKTAQPAPYDFKLMFEGHNDRARNVIWEGDIDYNFIIIINPILNSAIIQFENIVFKLGCKNISGIDDSAQTLRKNITFENDVKNISLMSTSAMSLSDGYLQNVIITSGDYKDANDDPQTVTIDRNRNYVTTVGLTSLGQVQAKNLMD